MSTRRIGLTTLIALLICVYTLTNSGRFHIIDEVSLFAVTESLGQRGAVDTNAVAWTQWVNSPGEVLGQFGPDGQVYSKKGPAPAVIALPWYLLLRLLNQANIHFGILQGALLWNGIVTALTAALLWLTAVRLGYRDRTGLTLALLFGLSTIAWPYANQFFGEPLSALSLLLTVYAILIWRQRWKISWMVLAGAAAGVAIATVTAHALLIGVIGFFALVQALAAWRSRTTSTATLVTSLVAFVLPLVVTGGLLLFYNWLRFGSPFETGYHFDSGEGFTTPIWKGAWGLLFSPYRSVFLHTPLFVVSLFAIIPFVRRHRSEGTLIVVLSLTLVALYSMWWMWWAGFAWGPRFLVPLTPFWVLVLAPLLERQATDLPAPAHSDATTPVLPLQTRTARGLLKSITWLPLALVVALSTLVQLLAVTINFASYEFLLRTQYFPADLSDPLKFGPPAQSLGDFWYSPVFGQIRLLLAGGLAANSDLAWLWPDGNVQWIVLFIGVAAVGTLLWVLAGWWDALRSADHTLLPAPPMRVLTVMIPIIFIGYWLSAVSTQPDYGERGRGYRGALSALCQQQRPNDALVTVAPFAYQIPMNWLSIECKRELPIFGYATSSMEHSETEQVLTNALAENDRIWMITGGLSPNAAENTVERWLADRAHKADDRWFDDYRLVSYATAAQVESLQYMPQNFFVADAGGNSVTIVSTRAPERTTAGAAVPINIRYRLDSSATADLHWFVQLLAADGSAVALIDTAPDDGYTPFTTLPVGSVVEEKAGLQLPSDLADGSYQLIAGLYNPTGEGAPRLRAADGREYLVIGAIAVKSEE